MSTLFITVEGIGWDIGYSLTVSALLTHAYKTHSTTRNLCTKYSHPLLLLVMMMLLLLLLRCVSRREHFAHERQTDHARSCRIIPPVLLLLRLAKVGAL